MAYNCTRFVNMYSACLFMKEICDGKIGDECKECIATNDIDNVGISTKKQVMF